MAQAMIMDSKLRILYDNGLNEKGEQVIKTKTYSNIRKDATAEQLLQAARAIAGLSSQALVNIERADNFELID